MLKRASEHTVYNERVQGYEVGVMIFRKQAELPSVTFLAHECHPSE